MTKAKSANSKHSVPVYCNQCVAGPDLMKVEVEDGVAARIVSNYDIEAEHPGRGRVCVKAYGLVQKVYNPNRIKQPMKRTNPVKGRHEDPGFVPISWDEAFDTVADRLKEIRARGFTDESGFPRLAASFGGGGTPIAYMGTFPAFLSAWGGPIDLGFGSGQGVKCTHSEHLYGELWHRAFTVSPDSTHATYIISCGNNTEATGGVAGVRRGADARVRGLKRVQVEPHMSVTAAVAAEWVPIRPKTDAAFLYALIHRLICERDWRTECDSSHLMHDTNSPYLVGPHGYYLREIESGKPLIWDQADARSKPFDGNIADPALTGTFEVSGREDGPDGETWTHESVEARPAFQLLIDHMTPYSPEWAEGVCDVPAERIRTVADEYLEHACVGETIEIEGVTLPYRPVAIILGKTVNNGWGGFECCWARTMLAVLVGALEVPGGTLGTMVKLNRPANNRFDSAVAMADGFMEYPFNDTSKEGWLAKPDIRNAYRTLVPLAANSPWSPALGPAHLPWLFQKYAPENWPKPTKPEMWICYRTNPAISSQDAASVAERIAEFPFTVAFAYTMDETNHMADILLPDATDLESMQLLKIGSTKTVEQYWRHEGWAIRQPVVESPVDVRDMTDISTALSERVGILEAYNAAVNRGSHGVKLTGEGFDYSLAVDRAHDRDAIWNASAKAASHELTGGDEVHDLDWFKANGYMLKPLTQLTWYLYPHLKRKGIRFEMPYQERIKRHGRQLANRLHEIDVAWWDDQLEESAALPPYKPFPEIWINYAAEVGRDPEEFPFWAVTAHSMQYNWGANVGLPLINEMARNVAGHNGVVINRRRALGLGIRDGEPVVIESVMGKTRGRAVLREGIRPDTILMIGQFDHWKMPVAKDLGVPSLNSVQPLALSLTDATGSTADLARVKIAPA